MGTGGYHYQACRQCARHLRRKHTATVERPAGSHGRRESQSYPLQSRWIRCCASGGAARLLPGFASIPNGLSASATSPPCTTCFSKTASLLCTLPWHGISPWSRKMIFCCQALKDILFGNKLQEETSFNYTCPAHKLNRKGGERASSRSGNLAVLYGLRGTL